MISELRDVHHSPDGNFCMRAYLRRAVAAVEDSGRSAVRTFSVSRVWRGSIVKPGRVGIGPNYRSAVAGHLACLGKSGN
jgi:hypothetical protein